MNGEHQVSDSPPFETMMGWFFFFFFFFPVLWGGFLLRHLLFYFLHCVQEFAAHQLVLLSCFRRGHFGALSQSVSLKKLKSTSCVLGNFI